MKKGYEKIFFIQEHIAPAKINGVGTTDYHKFLTTDFIVAIGYIKVKNRKKHSYNDRDFKMIFDKDGNVMTNYMPEVFFKTYESGCKMLTSLLSKRCSNDATIRETFNKLLEKYPEYAI